MKYCAISISISKVKNSSSCDTTNNYSIVHKNREKGELSSLGGNITYCINERKMK